MCGSTVVQTLPSLRSLVAASMSGVMYLSLSHGLEYGGMEVCEMLSMNLRECGCEYIENVVWV